MPPGDSCLAVARLGKVCERSSRPGTMTWCSVRGWGQSGITCCPMSITIRLRDSCPFWADATVSSPGCMRVTRKWLILPVSRCECTHQLQGPCPSGPVCLQQQNKSQHQNAASISERSGSICLLQSKVCEGLNLKHC